MSCWRPVVGSTGLLLAVALSSAIPAGSYPQSTEGVIRAKSKPVMDSPVPDKQGIASFDLTSLYTAHQWFGLRRALEQTGGPALYRGAAAAAFNDSRRAESILRAVIKAAPHSDQAYEAYGMLVHCYLQTGQYRRLSSIMMERSAAFPGRGDLQQEQGELAPFRNLPDQTVDNSRSSSFRHKKDFFVPVSINGRPASYFLDTGAAISCMSASEARRLGLTIRKTRGNIGTATGRQTGFRTAVARRLSIGNVHLKNVSFAVFRDDQEPWSLVPPGRRGLFGIPVLLAFRTLSWTRSGTIEVGSAPGRRRERQPNLCFADDHLVMAVGFQQRQILATLDTGAVSTDLYAAFAREFSELTRKSGKKGSTEVRGVGQAANYESITLPELTFHIGGYDTVLRPVPILLRQIGPKYCCGNIGMDLLQQARAFRLDFGAMTLELQ